MAWKFRTGRPMIPQYLVKGDRSIWRYFRRYLVRIWYGPGLLGGVQPFAFFATRLWGSVDRKVEQATTTVLCDSNGARSDFVCVAWEVRD
jgi:hypothetical protein